LTTIILAAGKSTRMLSLKSKILFKISGDPIIEHVFNASKRLSKDIVCVLSNPPEELKAFVKEKKNYKRDTKESMWHCRCSKICIKKNPY
jgi:bifunctional N-acetylglucosamine-1-phosphate-uridyltransferase/glucosamine-1-phosphate-acetyltransferase GlmU-like protein